MRITLGRFCCIGNFCWFGSANVYSSNCSGIGYTGWSEFCVPEDLAHVSQEKISINISEEGGERVEVETHVKRYSDGGYRFYSRLCCVLAESSYF